MTDEKKSNPPRSRRKRAARNPDAATRNPGQPATSAPAASGSPSDEADRARSGQPANALAVIPLHVRWRDLDAFNHVNNAACLTYLEEARLQWLRQVPGEWFNEHAMPVTASVEMRYRKPINWPAEIDVHLTCERLGNSSVTVGHRIVDRSDTARVYADGHVVLAWIDPATGAAVPLPDAIRAAVG
ncbi:MAG: acyl-CoA thioesterase [Rhodanobacteraceae bacterium]